VVAVGDLLVAHPEVAELDLNPLNVRGDRLVAVDARILVTDASRRDGGES
jgi:acetyltransferase